MTSFPAQILGLKDRGMLRENYRAGVTIFYPEKVRDRAIYANPRQYAEGAPYVTLNGEMVVDGGKGPANCRARFWRDRAAGKTLRINHD
ncbi:MAG TPA: hypothetical protein VFV58_27255 [Blastocatellia bacterium]|jgi:N-acyl-D-amino-acid deacylase|nr:hypothetical protein [Blastocatellia bacterium]